MKKHYIIFLFALASVLNADIKMKKNILVLHSYTQSYEWTKKQHDGFLYYLENFAHFTVNISTEHLDTKRVIFNDEYQSLFFSYLQKKYDRYHPDAIYVTDDDAFKFILKFHHLFYPDVPVFFSGVNDLSSSITIDHDKVTGVYEKKEIIPNIDLIKQFSPQTRDIWIVGDNSTTYKLIEKELKDNVANYSKYHFHFVASAKLNDILKSLPTVKRSFVILTTIGGFVDDHGKNLSITESIQHLKHNPNLIICSMEDAYVQDGVVGGYVTSGKRQGEAAASLIIQYFNGSPVESLKPLLTSPNIYMFDRKALTQSRLILSQYIARDAVILNQDIGFFEHYRSVILNSLFVAGIAILIFLIVIYFTAAEKRRYMNQLIAELTDLKKVYEHDSTILSLVESTYDIGYWTYRISDKECFFSVSLLEICFFDETVERTLETIMTMIPNENGQLQKAINDTIDMSYSHRLHHKIICGDGSIRNAVHVIHPVSIKAGNVEEIVGIIRIKND